MKKFFFILLLALFLFATPRSVEAMHNGIKSSKAAPTVSFSRSRNKLSVIANFSNLRNTKSVAYQLTYDTSKGPQGAGGTIKLKSGASSASRTLLLGTCSHRVCTYHNGVSNLKLSVDFKLKSGGIISYEKNI